MADDDDDAFYGKLQICYDKLETAIGSKCNMNQNIREDARNALGELKCLITKHFERIKSLNFREACKESLKDILVKPTYSSAVLPSVADEVKQNSLNCGLVVSSEEHSSEDIKKIIKLQINPVENKLGVINMKNIGNSKVLVQCPSESDLKVLQTEIQDKSPQLKATPFKRKNPTIIIKNVPNEIKDDEILDVILNQNPDIIVGTEWKNSRIRFTLRKFQNTRHLIVEMHPDIRKSILVQSRLKIAWSMCVVEDFIVINRCFKCLGYNHRAGDCTNRLACYFCSHEHESKNCPQKNVKVCINCVRRNQKIKDEGKKLNTRHSPFSENCSCHNFIRSQNISRTNYG